MGAGVIALINALTPWIPVAMAGFGAARELVKWGFGLVDQMVSEGRDPTAAEWDQLNSRVGVLLRKLNSDDE